MKTIWCILLCVLISCGRNRTDVKAPLDPLTSASRQTGVDRKDLEAIAIIESAGMPICGCGGLLQVKPAARKQVNKIYYTHVDQHTINTDANTSALFGARYLDYITHQLKKRGYKNPTLTQRYIAYQQGLPGFYNLKKTLKTAPDSKITPCQYSNLPGKIRGTSYINSTATQRQYYNYWNRKIKNIQAKIAACDRNS